MHTQHGWATKISHQTLSLCPKPLGNILPGCWGLKDVASLQEPYLDYGGMQEHHSG